MYIPILIESLADGRFRAREPFALAAEGESCAAATQALERLVAERLANGSQVGLLHVANSTATVSAPVSGDLPQANLDFKPLPDDDWFFQGLREAIAENRRLEDEADR